MAKRNMKVGLLKGRVNWNDDVNLVCTYLAEKGLHGRVIATAAGLSVNQVYYRCRQIGLHLRDYRDGNTEAGRMLIRKYSIKTIEGAARKEVHKKAITPKE